LDFNVKQKLTQLKQQRPSTKATISIAGSDANTYIAMSSILAAGAKGIQDKLTISELEQQTKDDDFKLPNGLEESL
jgi:glutamine synthetase